MVQGSGLIVRGERFRVSESSEEGKTGEREEEVVERRAAEQVDRVLQGYLAHKKHPPPLGTP